MNAGLPSKRRDALFLGERFYFTGRQCAHGHIAPRYASTSDCVQCAAERYGDKNRAIPARANNERVDGLLTRRCEAVAKGEPFYFTGKPCKNGHVAKRYSGNGCCVTCSSAQVKRWQADNQERYVASRDNWYQSNKDYLRNYGKARRLKLKAAKNANQ